MSWSLRHQIGIDRGLPLPSERSEAEFQQLEAQNQQSFASNERHFGPGQRPFRAQGRRHALEAQW
jgi:hypothetical protein